MTLASTGAEDSSIKAYVHLSGSVGHTHTSVACLQSICYADTINENDKISNRELEVLAIAKV